MPISVVCPACKTEFKVSDKFAGKQGPCPKCKAPIKVPGSPSSAPSVAGAGTTSAPGAKAAAPLPEVKIHAPDPVETKGAGAKPGAKTSRSSLKPLMRQETKLRTLPTIVAVIFVAGAFAGAWFGAALLQDTGLLWLRAVALLVISIPAVMAGYSFLRNDELEPYRGRSLWLRSMVCAIVYTGLWCAFYFLPPDMTRSAYNWFFLAPPMAIIAAVASYACYDLDFTNALFHYCFYVAVTLAVGAAAGLHMPWVGVKL